MRQARQLAKELADAGVPVVSGLAAGIDTAALSGALSAGGRAVAVIGTGLRHSYPKENAELQERISTVGLVISQFLPHAPPTKTTFPMRNAVMSGYSAATVVVEAPYRSGASTRKIGSQTITRRLSLRRVRRNTGPCSTTQRTPRPPRRVLGPDLEIIKEDSVRQP